MRAPLTALAERHDGAVLDLLRDIVDELRALRADLARDRRYPSDEKPASDLLPVLAAAVADRAFSSAEVIQHARLVSPELRQMLEAANGTTGRKLGKLFRRLEGRDIEGRMS